MTFDEYGFPVCAVLLFIFWHRDFLCYCWNWRDWPFRFKILTSVHVYMTPKTNHHHQDSIPTRMRLLLTYDWLRHDTGKVANEAARWCSYSRTWKFSEVREKFVLFLHIHWEYFHQEVLDGTTHVTVPVTEVTQLVNACDSYSLIDFEIEDCHSFLYLLKSIENSI